MAADASGPKGPGIIDFDLRQEALGELLSDGANVVEVVGVIKWFDVSKGYGFIVPDTGMADVLLHVTCLRRDGYQTAYEGSRVVCEALAGPKGLQGQVHQGNGILSAAKEQGRPLELARYFPHDMDGFRFQLVQVIQLIFAHCTHILIVNCQL